MNTFILQWTEETGFLSFYHKFHQKHGEPFADCVDSTAIWLTVELLNGAPKSTINQILYKGLKARKVDDISGRVKRYPGSNEELKRDQLDFLVPLMREVGLGKWATELVELYGGRLLPHWKDHFYNVNTFLGRMFECGDSISDWFSNSESSQMNNISRLLWASYHGHRNNLAIKLFRKKIDPLRVVEIYGSRNPDTPQENYSKLPGMITVDSPPPIYLGWKSICKKYL